jgi:hypothetical protein
MDNGSMVHIVSILKEHPLDMAALYTPSLKQKEYKMPSLGRLSLPTLREEFFLGDEVGAAYLLYDVVEYLRFHIGNRFLFRWFSTYPCKMSDNKGFSIPP